MNKTTASAAHNHIRAQAVRRDSQSSRGIAAAPPTYGLTVVDAPTPSVQLKKNETGLPDELKAGIEALSGMDLSAVRVHHNSSKPAQLHAHAFAQGTSIHVAPGQEHCLPHEAWHVVQQAQGRVRPTRTDGSRINDDEHLEAEADVMGTRALQKSHHPSAPQSAATDVGSEFLSPSLSGTGSLQLQETLEQNIQRILAMRGIMVTDAEAAHYAVLLTSNPQNTEIQVFGRHRALKLNNAGVVSSIARKPGADASHMRVSGFQGPMQEGAYNMLTGGPRPLTGAITEQDATIHAATLSDIPTRPSLAPIMGGSATLLSGIENSEWLHLVAHSLGGADAPANLVAGPHSLNTAMIPFERLVRTSARAGRIVDYRVTFFSDVEGSVSYVHHVQITMTIRGHGTRTWTLEVNRNNISDFINGHVIAEIEAVVSSFAPT